jgi:GcrA cell cycle regulator
MPPGETRVHDAGWTDPRVAQLRKLWETGKSAAQIASDLGGGVTRNAVLGKAMRLKLPKRPTVSRRYPAAARKASIVPHGQKGQPKVNAIVRRASAPHSLPPMPIPADDETDAGLDITKRVGLLDLNNHTCRWPVGPDTGAKQMFCGCHADLIATGPYCPEHTRKAEAHR